MIPINEMGVIVLFAQQCEAVGFEIISIQMAFPDAVVIKGGIKYKAEFEYRASSFKKHGHDPRGCDLVICWMNDWSDCPLPVLALSEAAWPETDLALPSQAALADVAAQWQVLQMQRENRPKKKKPTGKKLARTIKAEATREFWRRVQRLVKGKSDTNTAIEDKEQMEKKTNPGTEEYQGYSAHITDDQARAAFVKKYGREPAEIKRSGGCVLAGPLTNYSGAG